MCARNPTWGLVFLHLAALVLRLAMIGDQPAELTQDRDAYLGIDYRSGGTTRL